MVDPIFWLGLSLFLVAVSLTAVLIVAIPVIQELARAARSIEKLSDTLARELPPTLEAIRLTGLEITELTDDMTEGVKSAGKVAKQVDESLEEVRRQAQSAQVTTRSVAAGVRAAWKTLTRPSPRPNRRPVEQLRPSDRPLLDLSDRPSPRQTRSSLPAQQNTPLLDPSEPLYREEPVTESLREARLYPEPLYEDPRG